MKPKNSSSPFPGNLHTPHLNSLTQYHTSTSTLQQSSTSTNVTDFENINEYNEFARNVDSAHTALNWRFKKGFIPPTGTAVGINMQHGAYNPMYGRYERGRPVSLSKRMRLTRFGVWIPDARNLNAVEKLINNVMKVG